MRGALKERAAASLRPFAWRSEVRRMRGADQSARGKDVQRRGSMAETTCFMQSLHHFKTTFFISMEGVHYYNEHKQLGPIAIQKCPPSINCPRVHMYIYTHTGSGTTSLAELVMDSTLYLCISPSQNNLHVKLSPIFIRDRVI